MNNPGGPESLGDRGEPSPRRQLTPWRRLTLISVATVVLVVLGAASVLRSETALGVVQGVVNLCFLAWLGARSSAQMVGSRSSYDVRFLRVSAVGYGVILIGVVVVQVWAAAAGEFRARQLVFVGIVALLLGGQVLGIVLAPRIAARMEVLRVEQGEPRSSRWSRAYDPSVMLTRTIVWWVTLVLFAIGFFATTIFTIDLVGGSDDPDRSRELLGQFLPSTVLFGVPFLVLHHGRPRKVPNA